MMTRFEAWLLHAATLLVGASGLAYAWLRYVAKPKDPFALAHPWVPHAQHLHVLTAPLLVFGAGLIWRRHVLERWRNRHRSRRASGLAVAATLLPMVASGYLLQVSVSPAWRRVWLGAHLATSAAWLLGYLTHQLTRRRPARGRRSPALDSAARGLR